MSQSHPFPFRGAMILFWNSLNCLYLAIRSWEHKNWSSLRLKRSFQFLNMQGCPHFYHPFIDGIFRIFHEINHLAIGMFVSDFPMEKKKHPASQPQSVHHRPPAGARSGSRWRENCTPPKGIIGMAFQGNPIAFRHLLLEFRN